MAGAIQIDQLADAVIKEMQEYADITNDNVKKQSEKLLMRPKTELLQLLRNGQEHTRKALL